MANFLQQIKLDGELYDLHDSEFIIDNRTAAGAALTGVSKAPALFDGMQISYWLDYAAGSSATLNLTLADGTKTGAIPVYYSGTSRLTTHYAAGNVLHMTYRENAIIAGTARGAGWWCDANYYSDSNYDIFGTAMDVDTAVYNYSLFAITGHNGTIAKQTNTNEAGTYWKVNSFTQSAGTGTSKKATTKGFYPYKIFYNPNNTSYTTAGGNTSTVASGTSNVDLRYTVNGSTSANIGATGAPFFLVGTIESDGLFYLKGDQATKEWWTAGIPTTKNTDYVYWFVGVMSSAYQLRLSDRNWFLKWTGTGDNDHLIQFEPWFTVEHANSADSVPWSGVTGKPSTFTPASHSHGYISNDGSIPAAIAASPASGDKIVITDSSDNDKVKGSIAIGSDDGKFLKHDGTWGSTTLVWVPDGQGEDSQSGKEYMSSSTIAYDDILAANTSGIPIILTLRNNVVGQAIATTEETAVIEGISGTYVYWTVAFPSANDAVFATLIGNYDDPSARTGSRFYIDSEPVTGISPSLPNKVPASGDYVLRSNGAGATWQFTDIPVEAPSTNGNYSLNVSNGTTTWTTASGGIQPPGSPGDYYLTDDAGNTTWMPMSGASVDYAGRAGTADSVDWSSVQGAPTVPNTPDAPPTDGNYVLNVNSGSSSWQEDTTLETFLFDGSEEVENIGTCLTCSTKTWDDLIHALTYKQVQVKSSVGSLVLTNYEITTQSGVEGVFSLMVPAIGAGNKPAMLAQFAIVHIGQTLYIPLQLLAFQIGTTTTLNTYAPSTYTMPSFYIEHGLLGVRGDTGASFTPVTGSTNRILVWSD